MQRDPALHRAALCVLLLLAGLVVQSPRVAAAEAVQTFGPGQVNCQALTGTRVDCLLAANRVKRDNRNVATFSVTALPRHEEALFRRWCLAVADDCTVTLRGRRVSPQSTRLSSVASVHWTRLSAPMNDVAAVAAAKPSTTVPAIRRAQ
jgi:hypothetical protein